MDSYIHRQLRQWYYKYGRISLPWRNTTDPYAIYISEVMLQQTQVQTVLERYYHPFLERFPTLQALAVAPVEAVLKSWEGLGYYSRAHNLHRAAQLVAPTLPQTIEGLMSLPGIGRNTAHAIAAFAFHQPVAVMEANVKRVIHRITASEILSDKALWDYAGQWVDKDDPFTYNQAMMDIGAMICTPARPQCLLCPFSSICKGKSAPERYPASTVKKAVPVRKRIIVVFQHKDYYYLAPRSSRFLGGLYGFPEYLIDEPIIFAGSTITLQSLKMLGSIEQTYSHFRLQADVFFSGIEAIQDKENWFSLEEISHLPLSKADLRIIKLIERISAICP